ncbi:restriction endonuclease [Patescibacteria group bacterium]|nr:restriction endonuclease [Patescibacteria group bacterium]
MEIIKASGEKQTYDRDKLCRSLKRVGVSAKVVDTICLAIEKEIQPGISTEQLAQKTSKYLKKEGLAFAARYNLKKSMCALGPHGFLFEKFVAALLQEYGYITKNNQIVKGECVTHEIDILAEKDNKHFLIEAKYHNTRGIKSDVQVAMYMYARLLDIATAQNKREKVKIPHRAWIFTNTKFTSKAIRYGKCMGISLTGWEYPYKESLEELIARKGLYPITVLPSVNTFAKEQMMQRGLLFARDILSYSEKDLVRKFRLHLNSAQRILKEARDLVK